LALPENAVPQHGNPQLIRIDSSKASAAPLLADAVFVHGLGGDPRTTWHPKGKEQLSETWLQWLADDLPRVGIWSLGYAVAPTSFRGKTMALPDRARNILAYLSTPAADRPDFGERPLIFIAHSMGGLLVKEMLREADSPSEPFWQGFATHVRGIVFLATPHAGSPLANFFKHVRVLGPTVSVSELTARNPYLTELNL